jgi:hypothetical protein
MRQSSLTVIVGGEGFEPPRTNERRPVNLHQSRYTQQRQACLPISSSSQNKEPDLGSGSQYLC